ncbi:hypothetical protein EDD36DRAFT_156484 [Exophiala viscosa]|uniref:Uncharacterized protein n=1 Tax=Exophiala viscosa TaxID=2486360 RepID=A0AAN6E4V4_9EURO|nr:hypothetical protein EDD36DRAFT_156484 [Exophiala viscosa]
MLTWQPLHRVPSHTCPRYSAAYYVLLVCCAVLVVLVFTTSPQQSGPVEHTGARYHGTGIKGPRGFQVAISLVWFVACVYCAYP